MYKDFIESFFVDIETLNYLSLYSDLFDVLWSSTSNFYDDNDSSDAYDDFNNEFNTKLSLDIYINSEVKILWAFS